MIINVMSFVCSSQDEYDEQCFEKKVDCPVLPRVGDGIFLSPLSQNVKAVEIDLTNQELEIHTAPDSCLTTAIFTRTCEEYVERGWSKV